MSLGLGVFLSSILLSVTLIYLRTRDHWRWRKIALWFGIVTVGLPALVAGTYFTYQFYQNQPVRATELNGITVGAAKRDVLFLKGKPNLGQDTNNWVYWSEENVDRVLTIVEFHKDIVKTVAQMGSSYIAINGVRIGDSYQSVIDRLGKPDIVSYASNGTGRLLSFKAIRTAIGFEKGEVDYLAVYDGTGAIRYNSEKKSR